MDGAGQMITADRQRQVRRPAGRSGKGWFREHRGFGPGMQGGAPPAAARHGRVTQPTRIEAARAPGRKREGARGRLGRRGLHRRPAPGPGGPSGPQHELVLDRQQLAVDELSRSPSRATTTASTSARALPLPRPAAAGRRPRRVSPERRVFRAMGVDVLVCGATDDEHAASGASSTSGTASSRRFRAESELNRVNRDPSEVVVLSPLFAGALRVALGAARRNRRPRRPDARRRDRGRRLRPRLLRARGRRAARSARRCRAAGGAVALSARLLSRPPGLRST